MKHAYLVAGILGALSAPLLAQAEPQPGGMLRTLPHGTYQCSLPGDAGGNAYEVVEEEQFSIGPASSYSNAAGRGTYILRGRNLLFTSGPKKSQKFEHVSTNRLRRGKLLCTRIGSR